MNTAMTVTAPTATASATWPVRGRGDGVRWFVLMASRGSPVQFRGAHPVMRARVCTSPESYSETLDRVILAADASWFDAIDVSVIVVGGVATRSSTSRTSTAWRRKANSIVDGVARGGGRRVPSIGFLSSPDSAGARSAARVGTTRGSLIRRATLGTLAHTDGTLPHRCGSARASRRDGHTRRRTPRRAGGRRRPQHGRLARRGRSGATGRDP